MRNFIFLLLLFPFWECAAQAPDLAEAAAQLREAVREFDEVKIKKYSDERARKAQKIGAIYGREGLSGKAIEYYQIALVGEANLEEAFKLSLWKDLATAFAEEKKIDSVLHYHHLQLNVYQQKQNYPRQLELLQEIARVEEGKRDYTQAITTYQAIVALAENRKDTTELIIANNNLGYLENHLNNFSNARHYFLLADKLSREKPVINKVTLYTNLAIAHLNDQLPKLALEYLALAKKYAKGDPVKTAEIAQLTANVYLKENDFYNAQQFNYEAINIAQQLPAPKILSEAYATAALIHQRLYEYEDALDFYQKHLNIRDSLVLEERLREQSQLQLQVLLEKTEKEMRLLLVNESMNELAIQQLELEKNNLQLASDKYELEAAQQEASLSLLQKENAIREAEIKNQELAALQAQQELRLTRQQLDAEQKDRNIADLKQRESLQELQLQQQAALEKERLQEIELLNQQQAISSLELEQQATFRKAAYITGLLMLLILGLVAASYFISRRANRRLAAQKEEIEKSRNETEAEKAKSEALLLNILPTETAKELKETGFATPRQYHQVSVLFTDFVNFTRFAESITVEALIEELNACFIAFDGIIERHGLEKIKTIGDAYMCAGGIPVPNASNAFDAVRAGLEMQAFIRQRAAQRAAQNLPFCEMRLGIHTGAVVAGVVGRKKFAYDIWGDAVNLASRMESAGITGKVNISETTFNLVKTDFDCVFRGEIEAKNKGKIGMYLVQE